jgi:hypothetical protein
MIRREPALKLGSAGDLDFRCVARITAVAAGILQFHVGEEVFDVG